MQPFLPIFVFALTMSVTPGPNNTLLMITCANRGFRATVPVALGVLAGFQWMVLAVGLGLGRVFAAWPAAHAVLKWVCFAWLLVLAWNIARAGSPKFEGGKGARPLAFGTAAAFQWVNPKAWMMAIGALTLFVPVGADSLAPVLRVALAYGLAWTPCALLWCLFGAAIARFLTSPRRVAAFNVGMAVLLVLSMLPTLF